MNIDLEQLIRHPEQMDKETLYDLRSLLALYPYYQPARLLLLQNLYLLHDPSFDEELRRSAVYITDRKVVFNLVEAAHYKLRTTQQEKRLRKTIRKRQKAATEPYRSLSSSSTPYPKTRRKRKTRSAKRSASQHPPTLPSTMWPICLILKATQTTHSSPS